MKLSIYHSTFIQHHMGVDQRCEAHWGLQILYDFDPLLSCWCQFFQQVWPIHSRRSKRRPLLRRMPRWMLSGGRFSRFFFSADFACWCFPMVQSNLTGESTQVLDGFGAMITGFSCHPWPWAFNEFWGVFRFCIQSFYWKGQGEWDPWAGYAWLCYVSSPSRYQL